MPQCCECGEDIPKSGFAKSQLKKKPDKRCCLECAAAREAGKAEKPPEVPDVAEPKKKGKKKKKKGAKENGHEAKKAGHEAKKAAHEAKKEAHEAKKEAEAEAEAEREAMEKAAAEADAKAKMEAEEEEKARQEAEAKARHEAEEAEKAKKEAEEAEREAEEKARKEAEEKAAAAIAAMEAKAKAEQEAAAAAAEAQKAKEAAAAAAEAQKAKDEAAAAPQSPPTRPQSQIRRNSPMPISPTSATTLPRGLYVSMPILTPSQRKLADKLCSESANQTHLFADWSPDASADTEAKMAAMARLEEVDRTYPSGGLLGYVSNARDLLDKSRRGVNPLEGWKPSVPAGQNFEDAASEEFRETEKVGRKELGRCGFVLVAGGLGERLGYGGIKIGLPTELATETCYAQYYIEIILAYQDKYASPGNKLPLCIMTSGDTDTPTRALLEKNAYFGMDPDQITIVKQGSGVPALSDNDARIAVDPSDPYKILLKPHGHGDVHALMHSEGVARKWVDSGVKWAVFFQDTNGLAFHTLPLSLGVSVKLGLVMNSTAVPRKAKQAVGGITKLTNENGETRTLNVEYNQLDPLLRATGFPDGDANDPTTGFSPYPGNINQLLFELKPYAAALDRTKGAMPEFVNPKYKDEAKTTFKKPTRLECMMQDFPTVLEGTEDAEKVGFTSAPAWMCFSPVKNTIADGAKLQEKGTQPGTAATGEADQYGATRSLLKSSGCKVEEAEEETYGGVTVVPGPQIVLKPSFVSCPGEIGEKFPSPEKVKISARSSLVVEGKGVVIESLDLDGALVIKCEEGASGTVRDLVVKNDGWVKVADPSSESEVLAMRGYRLNKVEAKTVVFKKDGSVEGMDAPPSADSATSKTNTKPANNAAAKAKANAKSSVPSMTDPAPEEAKAEKSDCACVIS